MCESRYPVTGGWCVRVRGFVWPGRQLFAGRLFITTYPPWKLPSLLPNQYGMCRVLMTFVVRWHPSSPWPRNWPGGPLRPQVSIYMPGVGAEGRGDIKRMHFLKLLDRGADSVRKKCTRYVGFEVGVHGWWHDTVPRRRWSPVSTISVRPRGAEARIGRAPFTTV